MFAARFCRLGVPAASTARLLSTAAPRRRLIRPKLSSRRGDRLDRLERMLVDVQRSVDRNHNEISSVGSLARAIGDSEAMQNLRTALAGGRVQRLQEQVLPLLHSIASAPRYAAGGLVTLLAGGYAARTFIYRKVAEESETLGKEVLEANIRNVITTLDGVAKDPETLSLLVQLLQELLDDPTTRKNLLALVIDLIEAPFLRQALIALLVQCFKDDELLQVTGVFALEALDTPDARRMLDTQVQRLVSATVLDEQVQADTAVGVDAALRSALIPSWFRGRKKDSI
jgi:hypothetical protein